MYKRTLTFLITCVAAIGLIRTIKTQKKPETALHILLMGEFKPNLAPENISTVALYHTHYNLWGTLMMPHKTSGIAKSFQLSENQLDYTFAIDPEARFSNGRRVTAADVKFSIERLMNKFEGGHMSAKEMIDAILTPNDETVVIHLKKPTPALRFLLSTPEFGIVPPEACDKDGKLVKLDITSGAYFITNINRAAAEITLEANPYYHAAFADSPKNVTVSFTLDNKRITDDVINGKADFTEILGTSTATLNELIKSHKNIAYKFTAPAATAVLTPNPLTLSEEARKYLASLFQTGFTYDDNLPLEIRSNQFLPPKTFGSLEEIEIPKINAKKVTLPSPLVIRVFGAGQDLTERTAAFLKTKGINALVVDRSAPESSAHLDARAQGMNSDFPEIELHLAIVSQYAWIKSAPKDLKAKIDRAFVIGKDSEREALIKEIGSEIITSGSIIPLTARSYVHFYNSADINVDSIIDYDGEIPIERIRMVK